MDFRYRVQISAWCCFQARKIEEILKSFFGEDIDIDLGDHRDPTQIDLKDSDEVDLLFATRLGPSIHIFFEVESEEEVKVIVSKVKEATMYALISFDANKKPSKLEPLLYISDLENNGKEVNFADT